MSAGGAKFRSRKIDYRKALHVFRASELPDIDEVSSHRSVPIIATGVEKEEEEVCSAPLIYRFCSLVSFFLALLLSCSPALAAPHPAFPGLFIDIPALSPVSATL